MCTVVSSFLEELVLLIDILRYLLEFALQTLIPAVEIAHASFCGILIMEDINMCRHLFCPFCGRRRTVDDSIVISICSACRCDMEDEDEVPIEEVA